MVERASCNAVQQSEGAKESPTRIQGSTCIEQDVSQQCISLDTLLTPGAPPLRKANAAQRWERHAERANRHYRGRHKVGIVYGVFCGSRRIRQAEGGWRTVCIGRRGWKGDRCRASGADAGARAGPLPTASVSHRLLQTSFDGCRIDDGILLQPPSDGGVIGPTMPSAMRCQHVLAFAIAGSACTASHGAPMQLLCPWCAHLVRQRPSSRRARNRGCRNRATESSVPQPRMAMIWPFRKTPPAPQVICNERRSLEGGVVWGRTGRVKALVGVPN